MTEKINENPKKAVVPGKKVCSLRGSKRQYQRIVKEQTRLVEILNISESENKRRTGIEIVGDIPWGTHFCPFYQTSQDLVETLVPYFREGLAANEFCMCVTSEPLPVEQAAAALRTEVPDIEHYIHKGQIEILDYSRWYARRANSLPMRCFRAEWTSCRLLVSEVMKACG